MVRYRVSGVPGSFAHIAAKKVFPLAETVGCGNFQEAYAAAESGECDYALLPIENSSNGDVSQVMDLIYFGNLFVNDVHDIAVVQNLLAFFSIYIIVCMATTGLMMAIDIDVTNSAVISLSCVNNVGLPLNELGPDMTWADMHWATKWLCSGLMLMGRLEILNVLILLTPSYWKDN